MKLRLCPLLAILVAPLFAQAESACPALVITGHPNYPPVAWAAEGRIVGAAPELATSIARQVGVEKVVSRDFGSWEGAQAAARRAEADLIFGLYKNAERARHLDYVEPPFMLDPVAVVVRKGEGFGFSRWEDLKGRRGVTNAGESFGDRFDAFMASDLTVARAPGVDKAFEALLGRQADYLIIGLYPGKKEASRLGASGKVEFLPGPLVTADMYMAFSKKSRCGKALRARFSERLKAAVERGEVQRLLEAAEKRLEQ